MTPGVQVGSLAAGDVVLDTTPSRHELDWLDSRLDDAVLEQAAAGTGAPLAVVARSGDSGVVGGLHGVSWGGCCELLSLWVHPDLRRAGLGARLLMSAEAEARRRDCRQIVLFTHANAPPGLYLRLGYDVAGVVTDYPLGLNAYWLRKRL